MPISIAKDSFFSKDFSLNIRGELHQIDSPWVMGILNLSPDSFYDASRSSQLKAAINKTQEMLDDGAKIIDIGAVSTRPGAMDISISEELDRILPVLKELRSEFPDAIFSIDSWRSQVAKSCLDIGADMINDISGGVFDEEILKVVGIHSVPYILMHTLDKPDRMQIEPYYKDVFQDISLHLANQIAKARAAGIIDIIIDPGFGFGKTIDHNYELLSKLDYFKIFEHPLLIGISRKSMIYKTLETIPEKALNGTTALHMYALERGAHILRVHDVREANEAIVLFQRLNQ